MQVVLFYDFVTKISDLITVVFLEHNDGPSDIYCISYTITGTCTGKFIYMIRLYSVMVIIKVLYGILF